jgi:hypothetical protein
MGEEQPAWNVELAVAVGRIEEGVKSMKDSLAPVVERQQTHSDTLTRHEVAIRVLESKQQPRIHWLTVLVGIVAISAFAIALFDRLFTHQ